MFSVRIVDADFYVTKPLPGLDILHSEFRESTVTRVPVLRIFGSTPLGQKTCLHVHQVFPYIFVPYDGTQPREKYLKQFTTSLDFAVQVALGKATSSTHHVYDASIVRRIPFYGYHEGEQEFIKIQFYNPRIVARVVELLQNGAILNKVFQPYEAHIPYILQFLIDYNLYGMNLLHAAKVKFRGWPELEHKNNSNQPSPHSEYSSPFDGNDSPHVTLTSYQHWNETTIANDLRLDSGVPKISRCELEVDVLSTDILNRQEIGTSIGTNPGIAAMWEDEKQRRRDREQSSQITIPLSQDRGDLPLLELEEDFKAKIREIISERNQFIQSQLEKMEKSRLDSLSPEDFHELSQSILLDEKQPESPLILSQDIDENVPVVDETIIEDVLQASQSQSQSQPRRLCQLTMWVGLTREGIVLAGRLDRELVDILVSLADDPNQTVPQECSPNSGTVQAASVENKEPVDESENEDEESLIMSQPVWQDEELREHSEGSSSGDNDEDIDGLNWKAQRIPQLDGPADDETDTMSAGNTGKKAGKGSRSASRFFSCSSNCSSVEKMYTKPLFERIPQLVGSCDGQDDRCQGKKTMSACEKSVFRSKTDYREAKEEEDDFKTVKKRKGGQVKKEKNAVKAKATLTRQRKSVVPLSVSGGNTKRRKKSEMCTSSSEATTSASEVTTVKGQRGTTLNTERYGEKVEGIEEGIVTVLGTKKHAPVLSKRFERIDERENTGKDLFHELLFDINTNPELSSESQTSDFELRLSDSSSDADDFKNQKKISRICSLGPNRGDLLGERLTGPEKLQNPLTPNELDGFSIDKGLYVGSDKKSKVEESSKKLGIRKTRTVVSQSCCRTSQTDLMRSVEHPLMARNSPVISQTRSSRFQKQSTSSEKTVEGFQGLQTPATQSQKKSMSSRKDSSNSQKFSGDPQSNPEGSQALSKNSQKRSTRSKKLSASSLKRLVHSRNHSLSSEQHAASCLGKSKLKERKIGKKATRLEFTGKFSDLTEASRSGEDETSLSRNSGCFQKSFRGKKRAYEGNLCNNKRKKTNEGVKRSLKNAKVQITKKKQTAPGRVLDAIVKLRKLSLKSLREKYKVDVALQDYEKVEDVNDGSDLSKGGESFGSNLLGEEEPEIFTNALYQMAMLSPKSVRSDYESPPLPSSPSMKASSDEILPLVMSVANGETDKVMTRSVNDSLNYDEDDVVCIKDSFAASPQDAEDNISMMDSAKSLENVACFHSDSFTAIVLGNESRTNSHQPVRFALAGNVERDVECEETVETFSDPQDQAKSQKLLKEDGIMLNLGEALRQANTVGHSKQGRTARNVEDDEDHINMESVAPKATAINLGNVIDQAGMGEILNQANTQDKNEQERMARNVEDDEDHPSMESVTPKGTAMNLGGVIGQANLGEVLHQANTQDPNEQKRTAINLEDDKGHTDTKESVVQKGTAMDLGYITGHASLMEKNGRDGNAINIGDAKCHAAVEDNRGQVRIAMSLRDIPRHVEIQRCVDKTDSPEETAGPPNVDTALECRRRQSTANEDTMTKRNENSYPSMNDSKTLQISQESRAMLRGAWKPVKDPPSPSYVIKTRDLYGLPHERHQKAFCSNPKDIPAVSKIVGGRRLCVSSSSVEELSEFDQGGNFLTLCQIRNLMGDHMDNSFVKGCLKSLDTEGENTDDRGYAGAPSEIKLALMGEGSVVITPAKLPPSPNAVQQWLKDRKPILEKDEASKDSEAAKKSLPRSDVVGDDSNAVPILSTGQAGIPNTPTRGTNVESLGEVPSNFQSPQFSGRSACLYGMSQQKQKETISQKRFRNSLIGPHHSTPLGSQPKSRTLFECTPIEASSTPSEKMTKECSPEGSGFESTHHKMMCSNIGGLRRNILASQVKETVVQDHPQESPDASCIEGPTPTNSCEFKISQPNIQDAKTLHEIQHLTVLSVELHIRTRKRLRPDPEFDAICAIFFTIEYDTGDGKKNITGVIVAENESTKLSRATDSGSTSTGRVNHPGDSNLNLNTDPGILSNSRMIDVRASCSRRIDPGLSATPPNDAKASISGKIGDQVASTSTAARSSVVHGDSAVSKGTCDGTSRIQYSNNDILRRTGLVDELEIISVDEEFDAINRFIQLVHEWDPDILVGFEVQMLSWGYLLQRATVLGVDLASQLSRLQDNSGTTRFDAEKDIWGASHTSEISIAGRIVLNVWRLMRHEVALNIYSFENIAYHVLHERIPLYTFQQLTRWWDQKLPHNRWRTAEHYIKRCQANIKILNHVDLINRTSEFARLYGMLFYSVISRGSQFRVESMMLRLVKPMNYLAVSPSIQQRARMCAPECIALVMEPESRFYTDPVVVLDFQSLYPSMIIAYNYCFSTCLGRVSRLHELGYFDFGCTSLNVPPSLLEKLEDDIHVSANGAAFVKSNIRRGILPRMLEEILNTRVMVKKTMKKYKSDKALQRLLDARQLGLKLIANVTYGYTSANFSGRMPCVEIADAIVRKARETLERAIHLVNTREEWGARVVYGDTDSLFVLLKGATKEEAFKIGKDIVDAVTADNPKPVKLKFEKVYLPCVLQTKKRYVGYMYETLEQKEPVFDAKGIETVRRDTCPAVAKILEKSLRILFEEKDISLVKKFVQRQFRKLMEDRVSLQDFIFAKEYRGMRNYKPTACVPALELTRQRLARDRRAEPRVGERVPYVVVYGSPGLPLIQLVRSPEEVLQDPALRLNTTYYITKQILPPLNRSFALIGIDVSTWYSELPRFVPRQFTTAGKQKTSISRYFTTLHCPVCEELTHQGLCHGCRHNPQKAVVILADRVRNWERKYDHLNQICFQCCGTRDPEMLCVSLDCPVLFKTVKLKRKLTHAETLREVQRKIEIANW